MLEKILAVFTALVASIEANTAAINKVAAAASLPAPEAPRATRTPRATTAASETPAPTPVATPGAPTIQELRAAAQALLDFDKPKSGPILNKLNAKYGTKRISEVPDDKRAEVIAALKAELAALQTPAPSADEAI